jgi:hypothetical protein
MVMLCYADDKLVIKDLFFFNFIYTYYHSFETRLGLAGRPEAGTGPG